MTSNFPNQQTRNIENGDEDAHATKNNVPGGSFFQFLENDKERSMPLNPNPPQAPLDFVEPDHSNRLPRSSGIIIENEIEASLREVEKMKDNKGKRPMEYEERHSKFEEGEGSNNNDKWEVDLNLSLKIPTPPFMPRSRSKKPKTKFDTMLMGVDEDEDEDDENRHKIVAACRYCHTYVVLKGLSRKCPLCRRNTNFTRRKLQVRRGRMY